MPQLQPLKVKPESLTQMVYEAIREAIITKVLTPGTPVSEASLSRELAVSKTPVREALLRLHAVGLIETDGSRSRVVSPSREIIEQAYEVRSVLEAGSARIAARRATDEQRAEILEAAVKSRDCAEQGDTAGFQHWDTVFHLLVAEATSNPRLISLVENALGLTSVLRQRDAPAKGFSAKCGHQHVAIAEAIRDGRDGEASEVAIQHVLDVQQNVLLAADKAAEVAETAIGRGRR